MRSVDVDPTKISAANRLFWSELCGTSLARSIGLTSTEPRALERFDFEYLGQYPYLDRYVPTHEVAGKRLLEIGLGYGTLGTLLVRRGADYFGVDVAPEPVKVMRRRLKAAGIAAPELRALQASALALPFADATFDVVVAIGSLHHTGNLSRSIQEVHRVLRPSGRAIIMVYNRRSFRLLVTIPWRRFRGRLNGSPPVDRAEQIRRVYDSNGMGDAAPYTEFTTVAEARRLFRRFRKVRVVRENFDSLPLLGNRGIPRRLLLGMPARMLGLDLYITATK
jgi:SAM-dependent methyltransferase